MSNNDQWEVVTKSKKQKNFEKKVVAHKEKKKEEALQPKLEEILPSNQLRYLLTGRSSGGGKENVSPAKSNSSSKVSTPKKNPKTSKDPNQHQQDSKKSNSGGRSKQSHKPKSLEQAFKNFSSDDFALHLEHIKVYYPSSRWLHGVAAYLNTSLPFACDPTFAGKPITYPSDLVSSAFRITMYEYLESEGEVNADYFFNYTLLESMCRDLNNNLAVVGYKFFLQLIAHRWPKICTSNMANTAMLQQSYHNRSNICLSILWAVGQGGYQNLMEGITVWQNLMLPNLEMKNYCRFVSEYIEKVLNIAMDQRLTLNQNEFLVTYNALKTHYSGIPRECQESLTRSSELFLQKFIVSTNKHSNLFLILLRDIKDPIKNSIEINGCLSSLLHGADDCFKIWKMNYKKQLLPTIYLLQKLETEIFDSCTSLAMSSSFHDFLSDAKTLNLELDVAKKRDPNVDTLIALVKHHKKEVPTQKEDQQIVMYFNPLNSNMPSKNLS